MVESIVTLRIMYDPDECLDPHDWRWEDVLSIQMQGKHPQVESVRVYDDRVETDPDEISG